MREKLIELIKQFYMNNFIHSYQRLADHLIANGVIVPPCKIGDDIWWIDNENKTVQCEKNGVAGFIIKKDEVLVMDKSGSEDRIGTQYCYLTKEAAEKALKEGAYHG